jgi:phenylacetate-CoA ligase
MSEHNLESYYIKLNRIKAKLIVGYPSSLYTISQFLLKYGLKVPRPVAVITTAETLFEHQRAAISNAFKSKVIDQYGCAEMCIFVGQCEHGTYHMHPEYGVVEVIDSRKRPVEHCGVGEVICTGFVNRTMPLLRYRLGDMLSMEYNDCPCGRSFPIIKELKGRVDDMLLTANGNPVGRLDPIFKCLHGIVECQIVQIDRETIVLKIVKGGEYSFAIERDLIYEMHKRMGDTMNVHVQYCDQIPRDKNGKFRAVISLKQPLS